MAIVQLNKRVGLDLVTKQQECIFPALLGPLHFSRELWEGRLS